ncbi:MAG: chromosome segregation protein SMC [Proteobacteria bacterium]|nr:chromosome segregation protein SMC [Pseudomonadota bacterium]
MRIKRVDISGFKSFCDQTRVLFDQPVTAVVGPNGCGKSNIVDAIRWALGEQSVKSLRGKSMEDVIFNGSESRGPQSMAEVTITFDNTDGRSHPMWVDSSEIAITRRLHRDEMSEYLINKVPCRRMDITDLLLGTGGGARAYSIIEQGRIGIIVSSRSEDRRSMIEEAAGITKYKSARRTAERRMEQTRQNLLRVTDVVTEMERTLASLKRQAKKAERYKRYRVEQTDLDLYVATHRYLELRAQTVALSQTLAEKETMHLQVRSALDTLEARVASLRLDEQAAKSRLDDKTAAGYEINKEIQVIENEVGHLHDAVERHQAVEREAAEQETLALRQREEMSDEHRLLTEQMERLERERAGTATRYQELSTHANQARAQLEELAENHDRQKEGVSRARARQAASESAIENLGHRIEDIETRLNTAQEERASLKQQAKELIGQASTLEERTEVVENRLSDARTEQEREREIYDLLTLKVEACDEERSRVRDELNAKTSRKTSLEEVMSGLESHDRAVREAVVLLDQEGENLLDGLLIDYVECPEQYEKALAAALGDRLQALLVENREAGLTLLAMLKEREMGRVTVLAKNGSVQSKQTNDLIDDSQVLGPLVNFLECMPVASQLISALLEGVYVVEDLNQAEKLWKANGGHAAFVTLDGQLLESNGAMLGGRANSPGADLLGQKRQIRELSSEIETLGASQREIEERLEALKGDLAAHRDAGERARDEAQIQEIALAEIRKDNKRAVEDLEHLKHRFEGMNREIEHQEEMLIQTRSDRDLAFREAEEARTEISNLEKSLAEQSSEIEACREKSEKLASHVSDIRVQQAALEQQWQNTVERSEQLKHTQSEIEEKLKRIEEKRCHTYAELGRSAGEAVRQREVLNLQLEEAERIQSQIQDLRVELDSCTSGVTQGEDELKASRAKTHGITEEISALKMEEREASIAVEHLLETVQERNDCNLLRVVGDYHMKPLPGEDSRARAEELRRLIDRMGPINLAAIDEFESETKRYEDLVTQKSDLDQALEDLERAISRMDLDSQRRFKETFEDVNKRFSEIFPRLFRGGRAELMLSDPSDLLGTGVDIVAQPPGKRLSNIELLSGGEKALTAVAMLFAIFLHRPSPFCILDEVDAPLDEANVDRFIDMVRQMTDRSQFIIITHSKLTMERSNSLYGVTMEEPGISKLVSVNFSKSSRDIAVNE